MVELTEREIEILKLVIKEELSQKNIAKRLFLAESTVATHINNIRGKLQGGSSPGYWTLTGLKFLLKNGLITIDEI